jgi:PPM family protein phosphatase
VSPRITAAGASDAGLQRVENQDRFHVDVERGVFVVIDGVGGHAAGSIAADVALRMIRARLERETGPVDQRIREAITLANDEILRVAATRPECAGMACVLTVAVVRHGVATVGHVGDARLYKLHHGRIEKITHDHSPVGEREDAGDIGELEAMRHPRRNEVYRDVGSEPRDADDTDFIDIRTVPFERDAALLLCSDGLSDLVTSAAITQLVERHAGDPPAAARALVAAANAAGGKDNVTAVCVQGDHFGGTARSSWLSGVGWTLGPAFAVLVLVAVLSRLETATDSSGHLPATGPSLSIDQVVRPGDSIMAALDRALAGSEVLVEPGEYREQIRLRDGVRLVSRVPRAAVVRLPAGAEAASPAVVADSLTTAGFSGFRIVGDAATPLGVGLLARDATVSIVDVEITGATQAALDLGGAGTSIVGSDIHDNPGLGLVVRTGASPRIANSAFARNGTPEGIGHPMVVESGATPTFTSNMFRGVAPDRLGAFDAGMRQTLLRDNWFAGPHRPATTAPAPRPGHRRRAES